MEIEWSNAGDRTNLDFTHDPTNHDPGQSKV